MPSGRRSYLSVRDRHVRNTAQVQGAVADDKHITRNESQRICRSNDHEGAAVSTRAGGLPIDLGAPPSAYTSASVANLFYWNNLVHDIQYQYGFDEIAGNFQVDTFGKGGLGGDDVRAEAQDGGGACNANFLTPPDGERPRMQMYTCEFSDPAHDGSKSHGLGCQLYERQ